MADSGAIGFVPNTGYPVVTGTPSTPSVKNAVLVDAIRSDTAERRGVVRLLGGVGGVLQISSGTLRIQGIVRENSVPVSRKVFMFRRDDGLLLGATISNPVDGTFEISTGYTDEAFVVCLDDKDLPPEFNALVFDSVTAK